jgi:demethylspheroidene O-methyltransferase
MDRWSDWRNARLIDPGFHRWAALFPLTRGVARRRAAAVFDLVAGFVYTQILLACVRLDVFNVLKTGAEPLPTLAHRLSLSMESAKRLLDAAVALRLLEKRGDDVYALGVLGAPLVDNAALAAMIEHHSLLYADLRDPVALLRGEAPTPALAAYWPYAMATHPDDLPTESVDPYTALMSRSQSLVADEILDAYSFASHRCLLDVGGGDGTFLAAVALRYPMLQLKLFDLPAVARRAQSRFSRAGLENRASAVGGDFLSDALPSGADVISLVRVVHDHDDERVMKLFSAARRALAPGGTLLIAEPLAETPGAKAMGDAYFSFYLLAMGRGQPRTASRLADMLKAAGFSAPRLQRTRMPLQTSVLIAN